MTITNLGSMCVSAALNIGPYISKRGAGHVYAHLPFMLADYANQTNIVSIDLDDGTYVVARGPIGRPYVCMPHPDYDMIFIGTWAGSSYAGQVYSFNYITGIATLLFNVPDFGGNKQGINYSNMYSDEAHKRVFFGGMLGELFAWDPAIDPEIAYKNYGLLNVDMGSCASMQINTTHAYVSGGGDNNKFLVIQELAGDETKTVVWKGTSTTAVAVYRDYYDDTQIYVKRTVSAVAEWYKFTAADPITATFVQNGGDPGTWGLGTRSASSVTGYGVTTPEAPGIDKIVSVNYTIDTIPNAIDVTLLDVSPYPVQRAAVDDITGKIICSSSLYGPLSHYDPATGLIGRTGTISSSIYGIGFDRFRKLQFFAGYPAGAFYQYDPAEPWEAGINPLPITVCPRNDVKGRITFICRASNKNIWYGTALENPPLGCQIVWYNPDNPEDTGEIDRSVMAISDTNYFRYPSFTSNRAGTKLVMSAQHNDGVSPGMVAVVYMPRKTIRYFYPLGSAVHQGALVSVESIKGANWFVGISDSIGSAYKVYLFNIRTGALGWTGAAIDKTGVVTRLAGCSPLYAHGYVWYYVGNDIVRLDPEDGAVTVALTGAGLVAGGMVWGLDGNYLYHYDSSKNLYKIPKADLGV